MKLLPLASFALLASLSLTGCAKDSKNEDSDLKATKKLSKVETCREAFRLIGKTTDEFTKNLGSLKFNLNGIATEFSSLSKNTNDGKLRASFELISDSLNKMSKESTFFEGNSMYLNELPLLTKECS